MFRNYLFLLSFLCWLPAHAQSTPDLAQARQLLQSNQHAAALKLLAPHEDARAGNVEFDYLLGVAALGDMEAVSCFNRFLSTSSATGNFTWSGSPRYWRS